MTVKQVPPKPTASRPARPTRAEAKVISPPPYVPELDAYGLKLEGGQVVPVDPCPDVLPAQIMADPKAIVDARLWEGRFDSDTGKLREASHGKSPVGKPLAGDVRITPRLNRQQLIDRYEDQRKAAKLSEVDWFSLGGNGNGGMGAPEGPLTSNYIPMIPGPATRQQYWADYWAASAKSFEASTHSGIARRACRAMVQFPIGRGVRWKFEDQKAQDAWEAFWDGNNMRRRLRSIAYDLSVFGEQFLRYFPAKAGDPRLLIIRQLDPATIYEVVTDQEDLETVYFYHQQFQTRMELYSPPTGNKAPEGRTQSGVTRYIIRQIDASEIDHWRINDVSGEARGRSDLFPVLGDLKRLRDLMTAKVIQSDIGTRVMAIVHAQGTQADINRVIGQMFPGGNVPQPGSIIGVNKEVDVDPFEYNTAGIREDFTYDELIDSISAGTGIARAYLGLSPAAGAGSTNATALTTTEPSVKSFEERQDILDELLHQMSTRVLTAAGIDPESPREFIFPQIAKEDSAQTLDNLEQSEANQWISKKTAGGLAAAELNLTDYDWDEEQKQIVEEFDHAEDTDGKDKVTGMDKPAQGGVMRRPMIRATSRQAPKLDPTKAQTGDDEPPGLLVGGPAGSAPGMPGGGGVQAPNQSQNGPSKNPLAANNGIRNQSAETRQTRESAGGHLRRTPDDPEYRAHVEAYERETAANLRRMIEDIAKEPA